MKFSKERCGVLCMYVYDVCVCLHIPFWLIGGGRWRFTVFKETLFSESYRIFSSLRLGTLLEAFPNSKKPCQVSLICSQPAIARQCVLFQSCIPMPGPFWLKEWQYQKKQIFKRWLLLASTVSKGEDASEKPALLSIFLSPFTTLSCKAAFSWLSGDSVPVPVSASLSGSYTFVFSSLNVHE